MARPFVLVVAGVLFAALAGLMTFSWLDGQTGSLDAPVLQHRSVVVAAQTVGRGELVEPGHLKVVDWPAHAVPEGTYHDPGKLVGKVARVTIMANEPVTDARLSRNRSTSLLSMLVQPGRRAISVRVNEVTGISGFVAPNSRVDVLVTIGRREKLEARSKVILQDVRVLAIDQEVEQVDNKPVTVKTVTLDVTPRQAEILALAVHEGSLYFVLRNDKDGDGVATSGKTVSEVLGGSSGNRHTVEVIRGSSVENYIF